jgi:tetratricopeptide (TPR) repeat protein
MAHKRPSRPERLADAPAKDNPQTRSGIRQFAVTWAALFSATLIAYAPALLGGQVWDDEFHVTAPELQSLHGLWRIWFDLGATKQYYPLLHSAFWLEHRIWGDAVLGYHLTNVALHALAACLVVFLVKRLALPGAWLVGFVFALHPVCVEAVAWISEQKSTLSGVFYLAAALTYLHYDKSRRKADYWAAFGLFALALLSKSVTATLPAAILVLLWWMRGRLDWRRDVLPLLPWFGLALPAGLLTSWVEKVYIGAQGNEYALTLPQRILLAGRVPWFYAFKAIWPANLMFSYPKWRVDPGEWWQYLFPAGLAAVAIALALLARKQRGPLAALLIFGGTLFPVLGFLNVFPFQFSYVADHFQYLAILAVVIPASAWLTVWASRIAPGQIGTIALPAGAAIVLGVLTWQQSAIYRDEETLFRATLARNPDSYFVHLDLGGLLVQNRRLPEAIAEFQAAVRLKPESLQAHLHLANALKAMPGRLPDAIAEYQTAERADPHSWEPHLNLGVTYAQMPGRQDDAIAEYRTVLRMDPASAMAHFNLGNVYGQMPGRLPDAVAEFREALQIDPDYAEAHNNLGNALKSMPGQLAEAVAEFQAALRSKPEFADAHNNLGLAYAQMPGKQADAIAEYQAALRINPRSAMVQYNLGNLFMQIPGRVPDAIAAYRAAIAAAPDLLAAHYNLAYALAQSGRLAEAIAECREVLRLNPNDASARQLMEKLGR